MYSSCLQSDVLPFRYLLTYVLLYSIFINYHSWRDNLKETINKPSLLWNGKRECTFTSHEEQKNFFGQSWHLISVFSSKHIGQWSGEGRLSRLRRASSSRFLLLSQLDDKFTILVSQFFRWIICRAEKLIKSCQSSLEIVCGTIFISMLITSEIYQEINYYYYYYYFILFFY